MKENIKKGLLFFIIFLFFICFALFVRNTGFTKAADKEVFSIVPEENYLKLGVHIKGGVKNPGYYEFTHDARVIDVIEKAGGLTEDADVDSLNLAAYVKDGSEIYIPKKTQTQSSQVAEAYAEEKVYETAAQNTALQENAAQSPQNAPGGKININTAGKSELMKLKGIGEKTAQAIIDYRNQKGKFTSIEDIKKVKGIGDKKFEEIKDKITVN
ncbi:MAG: DUF655 domain-containing protein [Clostridiaceae bacterium]|nr:DUF655 domain-containing protein [Clostridiaceae bacterium]